MNGCNNACTQSSVACQIGHTSEINSTALSLKASAHAPSSFAAVLVCCCCAFLAANTAAASFERNLPCEQQAAAATMRPYLLKGHERPLTQVKYNREGDLVVSCAKDLQPCLWFADDGTRIGTYEGHNGAIWSCDMDIDSTRLITSSADQTVRIWDLPTGKELHQIKMGEPCRACHLSVGEQLLAFTTDSFIGAPPQIHIVNVDMEDPASSSPKPNFSIECPKGRVTRVYWIEQNRTLITSHDGGWVSARESGGGDHSTGQGDSGCIGEAHAAVLHPRGGGDNRRTVDCTVDVAMRMI